VFFFLRTSFLFKTKQNFKMKAMQKFIFGVQIRLTEQPPTAENLSFRLSESLRPVRRMLILLTPLVIYL
jgi:hypothetical protein